MKEVQQNSGFIATRHEQKVRVAAQILKSGGNAFDAVVAAHLASCVTELELQQKNGQ